MSSAEPERVKAPPGDEHPRQHAPAGYAWERLEDQLGWYDAKATHDKQWFQRIKVMQIVIAAAIPVAAGSGASAWLTGSLGASIVVFEGLQQLFQFQQNWTRYRATAEALKHEKHLYLACAGPYIDPDLRDTVLAERVESRTSQEHSAWSSSQEDGAAARRA